MSLTQENINKIKSAIILAIYILFVIIVWYYISTFLVDQESVRQIISNFGIFGPLVFIIIQIAQNIIAPIAHYPLAGGFIFGPELGFVLNWIGTIIGTILIILLTRKFGRPLVVRMVSKKFIDKYDHVIKKISPFGLFLIYALPIFPDDEISYLIGVSVMPIKSIIAAIILGKIPGASLSFVGDKVISGISITLVIQIIVLVIGTIIYLRNPLRKYFQRKNLSNKIMSSKNCIIIHGCPVDKEKALSLEKRTYDKHWMPWLKQELNSKGIPTEAPIMPEPWSPDYEKFKAAFEKIPVDETTVLVGHSCGCTFLVRWLGETKQQIDKLILVAPWKVSPGDSNSKKEFYKMTIDPTIKDKVNQITIFTADNEADEGKEGLKMYHAALGGEIINLKSHGHYTFSYMGTEEFPELLDMILK